MFRSVWPSSTKYKLVVLFLVTTAVFLVSFLPGNRTTRKSQSQQLRSFSNPTQADDSSRSESGPYFVTIIGAGASGLSAAYKLQQEGITNVVILEAANDIGGRVKKDTSFVDGYPIELGATIVNDPDTVTKVAGHRFKFNRVDQGELTFSNYSFYDFFAHDVADKLDATILLNCQVTEVNYVGLKVKVECSDGRTFLSKYTIVTVPLQILRDEDIEFVPPLPNRLVKRHPGEMLEGIKVFIKFSRQWFPRKSFCIVRCPAETEDGESYFWDYGVPHETLLVGLLMGTPLLDTYEDMDQDEIIQDLLQRMERKFRQPVRRYYQSHLIFNWTDQPFIRGTYSTQGLEGPHSVRDKVFLAGEAYPVEQEEHGWVHGAFNSGKTAAEMILEL